MPCFPSGEVVCHKADGKEESRLKEGDLFGESCLQHHHPHESSPSSKVSPRKIKFLAKKNSAGDLTPPPAPPPPPTRQANVVAVGPVRAARLKVSDCIDVLGPLHEAVDDAFTRKVLGAVPLFHALGPSDMGALISGIRRQTLQKGEVIISQGSPGTTFYIVRSGVVDVIVSGEKLKTLRGGDYFGERSLLKHEAANASVVASEITELMCISKTDFEALLGPLQALQEQVAARDAELKERQGAEIVWSDLDRRQVLGEGSFGCVRLCVHKPSAKPYALKALHKGHLIHTNQVKVSKRKQAPPITYLPSLSHLPHVPSFPSEHDQREEHPPAVPSSVHLGMRRRFQRGKARTHFVGLGAGW